MVEPGEGTEALEALLAQRDFVHGLARRLLADEQRAEDLAQGAFAGVLGGTWSLRLEDRGGARAYLAQVLRHLASKERRGAARRAARERHAARPEATLATDAVVAREEWRRRVVAAVLELEPREREVVLLRFFEGLPPRRIAKLLGLPVETIKTRLKRALASLRPKLGAGRAREELFEGLALLALPTAGAAPLGSGLVSGVAAMGHASKFVLIAVVVLCAGLAYRVTRPSIAQPNGTAGSVSVREQGGPAFEGAPNEPAISVGGISTEAREPLGEVGAEIAHAPALFGRVLGREDGRPQVGLTLELLLEGELGPLTAVSDGEGRFEFFLERAARSIELRVAAGPLSATLVEPLDFVLEPAAGRELLLRVPRGARIIGRVLDADDQPVPGAEVLGWCAPGIRGEPERSARVDGQGHFALEHLGEDFYIEPRAPGWCTAGAIVGRSGALASSEELILRMTRPGALRVRVRDQNGSAIVGAEVELAVREPWGAAALTRSEQVYLRSPSSSAQRGRTDGTGEHLFEGLAAVHQQVVVRHPAYVEGGAQAVPGPEPCTVVLTRGEDLFGTVVGADGQPAARALVRLVQGTERARTHTDEEGYFHIPAVRIDAWDAWLAVRAEGHAALVHEPVSAAESPLRLQLEPASSLGGVLLDFAGQPLPDAALYVQGRRTVRGEARRPLHVPPTWEALVLDLHAARTDAQGHFRFEGLHAGEFELAALHEHEGIERRALWVLNSGDEDLVLRFEPERFDDMVFEGRVLDALTGLPLREFDVKVIGMLPGMEGNAGTYNGEWRAVRADDGRYRLGGIVPMRSALSVRAAGYRDTTFGYEERKSGLQRLDLDLYPVRSLAVRVLDRDGQPLRDAHISVQDAQGQAIWVPTQRGAFVGGMSTDSEGRTLLQNLPASRVTLQIQVPHSLRDSLPAGVAPYERISFDLAVPLDEVQDLHTAFPGAGG